MELRVLKPPHRTNQLRILVRSSHGGGDLKNRVFTKVVRQLAQCSKPIAESLVLRNRENNQLNQLNDRIIVWNTHKKRM